MALSADWKEQLARKANVSDVRDALRRKADVVDVVIKDKAVSERRSRPLAWDGGDCGSVAI